MAGASMKDIKTRIRSVESTRQLTHAMQLVAASRIRRAREERDASRPFFSAAKETLDTLARYAPPGTQSAFLQDEREGKTLLIVLAGDRGLAGGYNSGVLRLAAEQMQSHACVCLPVGRKATESLAASGAEIADDAFARVEAFDTGAAECAAELAIDGYRNGRWTRVELVHTEFRSMLSQEPVVTRLLPLERGDAPAPKEQMIFEPAPEGIFDAAVKTALTGMLYAAAREAFLCETVARRMAMDSAARNAGQMIDRLRLQYNRARQGAITQELTEIVAGAENQEG